MKPVKPHRTKHNKNRQLDLNLDCIMTVEHIVDHRKMAKEYLSRLLNIIL